MDQIRKPLFTTEELDSNDEKNEISDGDSRLKGVDQLFMSILGLHEGEPESSSYGA